MPKVPSPWDEVPASSNIEDRRGEWDRSRQSRYGHGAQLWDAAQRGGPWEALQRSRQRLDKLGADIDPKFFAMALAVQEKAPQ